MLCHISVPVGSTGISCSLFNQAIKKRILLTSLLHMQLHVHVHTLHVLPTGLTYPVCMYFSIMCVAHTTCTLCM